MLLKKSRKIGLFELLKIVKTSQQKHSDGLMYLGFGVRTGSIVHVYNEGNMLRRTLCGRMMVMGSFGGWAYQNPLVVRSTREPSS